MATRSYRHMSAEDRETLSLGLAHGHSLRMMARVLGRAPAPSAASWLATPRGDTPIGPVRHRHSTLSNGQSLVFVDLYRETVTLPSEKRRLEHDGHWSELMHEIAAKKISETIQSY